MKIAVKKPVNLDFTGEMKTYVNGEYEIDDKLAKKNNYIKRYSAFPEHIEIIEKTSTPTQGTPANEAPVNENPEDEKQNGEKQKDENKK